MNRNFGNPEGFRENETTPYVHDYGVGFFQLKSLPNVTTTAFRALELTADEQLAAAGLIMIGACDKDVASRQVAEFREQAEADIAAAVARVKEAYAQTSQPAITAIDFGDSQPITPGPTAFRE